MASRARKGFGWLLALLAVAVAAAALAGVASAVQPLDPGGFGRSHKKVCGAVSKGHARCHSEVVTDAGGDPLVTFTPSGYGPASLQDAYSAAWLAGAAGGTQTVAVVDAYDNPNAEADLGVYRSQFGLPACTTANGCFRKVNQNGGSTPPAGNVSWGEEIALDLDMVSAVCPNCKILLVEATTNSFANLATAVDRAATMGATQISNSYGGSEFPGETTTESQYNHPGVAVTASSGDSGYGAQFPAASRYVTAVGGTTLTGAVGSGWSETTWDGAGSGCSAYVTKPSWQTDSGCAKRTIADVSAVSDPATGVAVYDTYGHPSGAWMVFGGTSAAAPIVAAYDALLGPSAASAQYIYDNSSSYNDVTTGANDSPCSSYLCSAVAGYDGPTGWGTPHGPPPPPPPGATTQAADTITHTTAVARGSVTVSSAATSYRFDYGPGASLANHTSTQAIGASGPVSATLPSLSAGTAYSFRLVTTNCNFCPSGTTNGATLTFTTFAAPTVSTSAVSAFGQTTATLPGSVNPHGQATKYRFEYGTTASYGSASPAALTDLGFSDESAHAVSADLTGLAAGTTYHYRLVADNCNGCPGGTAVTGDRSFTTAAPPPPPPPPPAPTVSTSDVTSFAQTTATLPGSVNPHGQATTYRFEYGPTTGYGSASPAAMTSLGFADESAHPVSANVTGLSAGATYHYRLVADNGAPAATPDRTFATAAPDAGAAPAASTASDLGTTLPSGSLAAALDLPPSLTLEPPSTKLSSLLAGRWRLLLGCSEACRLDVTLRLSGRTARRLRLARAAVNVGHGSGRLLGAGTKRVPVKLTRKARKAMARLEKVKLSLTIVATDPGGHKVTLKRTLSMRG